jgi:hypothetical protein
LGIEKVVKSQNSSFATPQLVLLGLFDFLGGALRQATAALNLAIVFAAKLR